MAYTKDLVSCVIINFNSGEYIFDCIDCLSKQTHKSIEVVVVDNATTDGSTPRLQQMSDKGEIKLLVQEKNLGSAPSNNIGIRNSKGEFVLILNADVFLDPDYIEKCLLTFKEDPRIGTLTGKLVSTRDARILDTTGIEMYSDGVGIDRGFGEIDKGQYDSSLDVPGACCAAAIYRRDMLEDIRYKDEYYDPDFFAFMDDTDLSIRSLLCGWLTRYNPIAVGRHVRGGSSSKLADFVYYLCLRNERLFYYKTFKRDLDRFDLPRAALDAARVFTIPKHIRDKAMTGFNDLKGAALERRKAFEGRHNYDMLEPHLLGSRAWHSAKARLLNVVPFA